MPKVLRTTTLEGNYHVSRIAKKLDNDILEKLYLANYNKVWFVACAHLVIVHSRFKNKKIDFVGLQVK